MEMIIEGEETLFGENINIPEEFIQDLCERMDNLYAIVMKQEKRIFQLKIIMGFLRAIKGRLNRVSQKQQKIDNGKLIDKDSFQKDARDLIFEGEESFFGESINTPDEFIKDFSYLIEMVYESATEEEEEMTRLAYLIGAILGLKSKLNRVCNKT